MRLTLRTMLAYLDDTLEPADAQLMGKKIEESEHAANIVFRTRDVMRRLRLGAPKLDGRGMGMDPNTVAEYLDSTLANDRVPDFEKVCLESDVHLAEVASCHQILAIVLAEPLEAEPSTRERMYKLIEREEAKASPVARPAETAAPATAAATADASSVIASSAVAGSPVGNGEAATAAAETSPAERKKPEVPEYLRRPEERGPWGRVAAIVAVALLLALVIIMAIDDGSLLRRLVGSGGPSATGTPVSSLPDRPTDKPEITPAPAEQPEAAVVAPAEVVPAEVAPAEAAPLQAPPVEAPLQVPGNVAVPMPDVPEAPLPEAPRPMPAVPAVPPAEATAANVKPAPAEATPAEAPAAVTLGRVVSLNQVLFKFDPAKKTWERMTGQPPVFAGDLLHSPPAFRSNLTLSSGVSLELLGSTRVELNALAGAPQPEEVPVLAIDYGRVVALTAGKAQAQLLLAVGDRRWQITFGDSGSKVAVEVSPVLVPGEDPREQTPQRNVDLYAASGMIAVTDLANNQSIELQSPAHRNLGAIAAEQQVQELPVWVGGEQLSELEKWNADFVFNHLADAESFDLAMKELAGYRRVEARAWAAQTLAQLGDVGYLVRALNHIETSSRYWETFVEELRATAARSPELATQVADAFQSRGDSGAALFRMVWGYTPENLREGAAATLVESLDDDNMDFRALAIWNLRHVTGQNFYYRPEATSEQRKRAVQTWKQRLETGQIAPRAD